MLKNGKNYSLEKVHPTLHNSVSINLGEPTNQHPGRRKRQKNTSTFQKLQPRTTNWLACAWSPRGQRKASTTRLLFCPEALHAHGPRQDREKSVQHVSCFVQKLYARGPREDSILSHVSVWVIMTARWRSNVSRLARSTGSFAMCVWSQPNHHMILIQRVQQVRTP